MADWKPFHGWMKFQNLDANDGLACSFTLGYRVTHGYGVTDVPDDDWTARFNRFKERDIVAACGGVNVMRAAVPSLVHHLGLDSSTTVFVPALSSRETVASDKGLLSLMTDVCAKETKAGFVPDAITKKAHLPLHKVRGPDIFDKRRKILDEAGHKSKAINAENIFVFDDLITSGDTLSHIAQAIREANQQVVGVYGVGLGKTERRRFLKGPYGAEAPNGHVPKKWEDLWKAGEAHYIAHRGSA